MRQAIELTKNYRNQIALNKLNLTVKPGEIFCLLGQNGAGKPTTINLFLGFTEAPAGVVSAGKKVTLKHQPDIKNNNIAPGETDVEADFTAKVP
jgi:ABC-2 type transport system ATP-binding protein